MPNIGPELGIPQKTLPPGTENGAAGFFDSL